MVHKLIKNRLLFVLAFVILTALVFVLNREPGTYLIGWDNTMPEFNPILNLQRAIHSIWQEYRGLGLYDGMAHAANLTYALIVTSLTPFIDQSAIRYLTNTALFMFGGFGMFALLLHITNKKTAAIIGGLFYLFNIGTIQQFYAPLEVFSYHFAFLPWITWSGLRYISHTKKSALWIFFVISLLSTPQGFVPTVFIASMAVFFSLGIFDWLTHKNIGRFLTLFLIFLSVNSFWLIPYLYGAPTTSKIIKNARINQYSSETLYLRNKEYGSLYQVATLNGFMLHLTEYDSKLSQNVKLMDVWERHSQTLPYQAIYVVLLYIGLIGIANSIKNKKRIIFLLPLLSAFFFLANSTPIVRELNTLLRTVSPILGEAFRIPFTKWITVYVFSLALFVGFGFEYVEHALLKKKTNILVGCIVVCMGLLYMGYPIFTGNLYSPLVKRKVPAEYLQVMSYFNKIDKNKRIALLPAHTFWSWQYRTWGHVGSGFLWYGIQQPVMDRAFDPWSNLNEQFYNELARAINTNDHGLFTSVLDKYNIDYLLLDQYLVNTLSSKPINYESLVMFLNNDESVVREKAFGKLVIYRNRATTHNDFIYSLSSYICTTQRQQTKYYNDTVYAVSDGYADCAEENNWIKHPFMNLFSEVGESDIQILANNENIILESNLHNKTGYDSILLSIPPITGSYLMPFIAQLDGQTLSLTPVLPRIFINGGEVDFSAPRLEFNLTLRDPDGYEIIEKDLRFQPGDIIYLEQDYPNTITISQGSQKEYVTVELHKFSLPPFEQQVALPANSVIQVWIPKIDSSYATAKEWIPPVEITDTEDIFFENSYMPHQEGYVAEIQSQFLQGLPINIYADNGNKKRPQSEMKGSKENEIQFMVIPPSEEPANGYTFHFENTSIGSQVSKTHLKQFSVYPIPYEFINTIQLGIPKISEGHISERVTSDFFSIYTLSDLRNTEIAVLSQAFDPGWKAYIIESSTNELNWFQIHLPFFFGNEIKEHVLINNWANGWNLKNHNKEGSSLNAHIVITFWPQYLEYGGFLVLFIPLGALLRRKHSHAHPHPVN